MANNKPKRPGLSLVERGRLSVLLFKKNTIGLDKKEEAELQRLLDKRAGR